MKLLDKRVIQYESSQEQKREVEQAVRLARRVDDLREKALTEEANLKKFREATTNQTLHEIALLLKEKQGLEADVAFLQEQHRVLIEIPLDQEWKSVEEKNAHLEKLDLALRDLKIELRYKEQALERGFAQLENEKLSLEEKKGLVDKAYALADERLEASGQAVAEAERKRLELGEYAEKIKEDLLHREAEVKAHETDLINKDKHLAKKESFLNDREREIQDKYETLLRTTKRIQKDV